MSLTGDILRSYRSPGRVLRRQRAAGAGEEQALAYVIFACGLFFVARLPALARAAAPAGQEPSFAALASGAFLGMVLMAPLFFYLIAGLSHAVARRLGGAGDWLGARLALFWALLAITPVVLLRAIVVQAFGPGRVAFAAGVVTAAIFLAIWGAGLREVERHG